MRTKTSFLGRIISCSRYRECLLSQSTLKGINPNSQLMRKKKKKKIEKTHVKEKQLYTQDNIYVVWQYAYIRGVTGISLLSGKKKYKMRLQFFLSLKNTTTTHNKTLITKLRFLHKTGQKNIFAPWTKPQKISH